MPFDLTTIGEVLRKAREERSLTVEQASEILYLKKSIISALESGDWAVLPHPVYVRGYLSQYARYLKVYDQIAPALIQEVKTQEGSIGTRMPARIKEKRERPRVRKAILGTAVAAVAAITLLLFLQGRQEISLPPQYETVVRNAPDVQPIWPVVNETRKLMIVCRERTWVRLVIDGAERREVMLNPEEVVMFTAKDKFDLLVGNSGGVKLFLNGKDTNFEGASGEVKRITLP